MNFYSEKFLSDLCTGQVCQRETGAGFIAVAMNFKQRMTLPYEEAIFTLGALVRNIQGV